MTASIHAPGTCRRHPHDTPALAGHYLLRARLGEGEYGEVFEAWDSIVWLLDGTRMHRWHVKPL
jgi:hypothetical protein